MEIKSLANELNTNSYPGRGIVLGQSDDGKFAVAAYFIMGRSVNSRNRIFEENERGGIRTKAFDESKMEDPSLIIYNPVLKFNGDTIVTNGDQTDTVRDFILEGKSFEDALRTRTFEPDPPNFTPRISGIVNRHNGTFSYKMSILKSDNNREKAVLRFFYEYAEPISGEGHFIHTYEHDGNPIPSFKGEPKRIKLSGDIDEFTKQVWESLNPDNKVSFFARYIDIKTGKTESRIVNKNS